MRKCAKPTSSIGGGMYAGAIEKLAYVVEGRMSSSSLVDRFIQQDAVDHPTRADTVIALLRVGR
jgi:hypothetical protein